MGVFSNAIWDAATGLWRGNKTGRDQARFEIRVRRRRGGDVKSLKMVVEVPNADQLRTALEATPAVIEAAQEGTYNYDPADKRFKQVE